MPDGTLSIVATVGGVGINKQITKTGDHIAVYGNGVDEIVLTAGKAATDWVKTDADTAACNLAPGHGYSTGKMDVFWDVGSRYDVDVTVTTNALALDGGVGDDFPESAETTVVVCTPQQINTAIDGDALKLLVITATVKASVYFEDVGDASIMHRDLVANEPYTWHDTSEDANPMTGNPITVCFASNGTIVAGVLTIQAVVDSTP